jgi:hypothetical protein
MRRTRGKRQAEAVALLVYDGDRKRGGGGGSGGGGKAIDPLSHISSYTGPLPAGTTGGTQATWGRTPVSLTQDNYMLWTGHCLE